MPVARPERMRRLPVVVVLALLFPAVTVGILPGRDVVASGADVVLGPVLDVVGFQATAILAAFGVGVLLQGVLVAAQLEPTGVERSLLAFAFGVGLVGAWLRWVVGPASSFLLHLAPDLVVPFVARLSLTSSTHSLYVGIHLAAIGLSSVAGAALLAALVRRREDRDASDERRVRSRP